MVDDDCILSVNRSAQPVETYPACFLAVCH